MISDDSDHVESNENENKDSIKEIFEKLENLSRIIVEKDKMINNLADKIKKLEENIDFIDDDEEDITEKDIEETDVNITFLNPYLKNKFLCEMCDFESKSNAGLQLHVKQSMNQLLLKLKNLATKII